MVFTNAMSDDPRDLDLLTIRQLKQVVEAQPQPYCFPQGVS